MKIPSIKRHISTINSVHEFRKVIIRESNRGERYKNKLSLIIYEVGSQNERDPSVRQFIRTITKRVRTMDDIGWFDLEQIGALLPHTPTNGAFRLSEDITNLLQATPVPLPFTVYSYPSQRWPVKDRLPLLLNLKLALQTVFKPHNITSSEDFRIYLNIELDRATRYGYVFSLIIFHLDKIKTKDKAANLIARVLNNRLRESDEIGWFGEKKIAAILPYAENGNCKKIVDFICKEADISEDGSYTIYTYPESWINNIDQPNGKDQKPPTKASPPVFNSSRKSDFESAPGKYPRNKTRKHTVRHDDVDLFIAKPIPTWKTVLDISVASLTLLFALPLFLFAALGIKLTSPGPVFFKQKRVGYMQREFYLYKFRTMAADADPGLHRKLMRTLISNNSDKGDTKLAHDQRIFPFGRFLRKSSIDELPQLINIFKREMSLVGPRPCLPYEADEYLRWHTRRFATIPGITGLWQVSGKNKLSFQQMIRLDINYEKHLSFWLDLKILFRTIPTVISIFFNSTE